MVARGSQLMRLLRVRQRIVGCHDQFDRRAENADETTFTTRSSLSALPTASLPTVAVERFGRCPPRTCSLHRASDTWMVERMPRGPEAVLHRRDEFDQRVARMFTGDGGAEDLSEPFRVMTFTKPWASPSAIARSRSSMPYHMHIVRNAFPSSCSFKPTRATSGSVNVAHGTTE